jgi:hybrid cluster-associated redox disulfide protein
MKITKKTKLNKIVDENPKAAEILFDAGMGCVGCPMAQQETLEQGCLAHGMNKKEIEDLVNKLNKK